MHKNSQILGGETSVDINSKKYSFGIVMFILAFLSTVSFLYIPLGIDRVAHLDINDSVAAKIIYANGTAKEVKIDQAAGLSKGDTVVFTISLPETKPFEQSELCFYQYHSIIEVTDPDGNILMKYGQQTIEKKKMLGDEFIHVPIPENAWGRTLTITASQQEAIFSDHFSDFRILKANDVFRYPLISKSFDFVVFLFLMVISLLFTMVLIWTAATTRKNLFAEIMLSSFVLLASVWRFGGNRMFYVLCANLSFAATIEYAAAFGAPIPLLFYFAAISGRKEDRTVLRICGYVFLGAFVFITAMDAIARIHFPTFEPVIYVLLGISFLFVFREMLYGVRHHATNSASFNNEAAGFLIAVILAILYFIVMVLRNLFPGNAALAAFFQLSLLQQSFIIFIITMLISLYIRVAEFIETEVTQKELKALAFVDILTGIHNRNYCVQELEKLDKEKNHNYGILFFDTDHLKQANDVYGHKVGDQLICETAGCISRAFQSERGFFGRWGGDEFIAVLLEPGNISAFEARFQHEIDRVNQKRKFPFEFIISHGVALNDRNHFMTANEICNQADQKMYLNKKTHHAM